jgi:signal transduction histidine kinase
MENKNQTATDQGFQDGIDEAPSAEVTDTPPSEMLQTVSQIPTWARVSIIAGLIIFATALHYGINLQAGAVHDVLTRSYYIPIVLAGLWFGIRGGFLAALTVTIVFFPHALHGWNAPYSFVFRFIEITMYFAIGVLTGIMSDRTRAALRAEQAAGLERERALHEKEDAYDALKKSTSEVFELEKQVRRSDRLAALGKLSAGLAHEIRNPLGSIKTAVEILANRVKRNDSETDSESAELYGVILEETERLNRTLTAFLDFARSEQDLGGTEPRRANIDGTIDKTVGLLKAQLEQRRVEVQWDPADLDIDIEIAESHLKQVLLNLILNSVEAMDGGVIRVKTIRHSLKETTFLVEDDGPGVPSKITDTIFDPFVSSKTGGTGLGLSVVARLAYSYGGSVDIDTKYSEGARFLVTLPTAAR